ncbi:divergent protein kinase domain 2A isoform X1 [Patella vulgata]|uniref:divergent protein kinase domain 2A isoform X1 n=2 Tax=Patella vulgata TaxID=6465 RepID=UPI00217FA025|nr:divergent protein kinase domain 2A isoform X1 [Patella vulgata]
MLPGAREITRRRQNPSMATSAKEIQRVVNDSQLRYKQLPTRAKFMLVFSLLFSLYLYWSIYKIVFTNDLQSESFLETDKCPACYGMSACGFLLTDQVKLTGWSKLRFLDVVNVKNVHFGKHVYKEHNVVLKKLALDKELVEVDNEVCKDANREPGCDIARVIYKGSTPYSLKDKPILPKHLSSLTVSMFTCASYRLLDRMWSYYKERLNQDDIMYRDKVQLWYLSKVNTEPLVMQTFPAREGWPFPEYYGACGRFIVSEHGGRPLQEFYHASFEKRVDIAYQIMKMALKMTENRDDFILYWTDIQYENFAVDAGGKVRIIDAENIIVVDKMAVEATKPRGWNDLYESDFDECNGENCLTFSTNNLCRHVNSDHNYYAACRNLLSQYGSEPGMPGGLLHDMPDYAKNDWELDGMLNECARPSKPKGRIIIKERLIEALDQLRKMKPAKDINVNILDALKTKDDSKTNE